MDCTAGRRVMVMLVALFACGFDSGGDTNGTGDTSSSATSDPATTDSATTNPPTTNPPTTDPATTESATTDTSTDPATTDDPTTTDPTTDSATDPTTGDETTDTDPSQGTSTGGDPSAYGPCDANTCPDGQICAVAQNEANTVVGNTCRPACGQIADCPVPSSGSPQIFCPAPEHAWCVLECAMSTCPDGMECFPTPYGEHCHWPL